MAKIQKLREILSAIYDMTEAAVAVCDCEGRQLAACPEAAQLPEAIRVPIVREGAEVGSILLAAVQSSGEPIGLGRLSGAVRLIDVMLESMGGDKLLQPTQTSLQQRILKHIESDIASDLSVQALCQRFSVSKSELYRILREQAPQGVAAYIREKRFQKACELLRDTNKPIRQVAKAVGYDDPNYFLRAFRREIGISAGKYRKGA